jgi:ABC-2 type transport system permease protein
MNIIWSHLLLAFEYLKINVKTAVEYRTSFIIQVISMAINNIIWLVFWFYFFDSFGVVNGYVFLDMLLLYGLIATAYGLAGIFAQNRKSLASMVNQGRLDYYLTLPKNVFFHLTTSGFSAFAVGDLIFGLIVLSLFVFVYPIHLILLFLVTATILLIAIDLIGSSLAFYVGNSERISNTVHNTSIAFATYPIGMFTDWVKIILLTVIPVAFISAVPLEVLKVFTIEGVLLTIGVALLVLFISIIVFYYGLRRYESGNLLYVRT